MMKKKHLVLAAAAALLAPHAMAANYPTKAFDALYTVGQPQGNSELRMASDGKGLFLTVSKASGFVSSTVVDYIKNTSTTLIEQGKIAMQTKLPPNGGYIADDNSAKQQGGKPIGNKVIGGHPCHGFEYTTPNGKSQTWIGDDVKIMVQSISPTQGGNITMTLKSVKGSPSADDFKIPAGYKLMVQ
jgi:hypothetical protein